MASVPPMQNAQVPMSRLVSAIDPVLVYKIFLAASSFLITSGADIIRRAEHERPPSRRNTRSQARPPQQAVPEAVTSRSSRPSLPLQHSPYARPKDHYSLATPTKVTSQAPALDPSKDQHNPTIDVDISTRIVGHGNSIRIPSLDNNPLLASILSHASKTGSGIAIKMGVSVYGSKNSVVYDASSTAEGHSVHGKKRKLDDKEERADVKRR